MSEVELEPMDAELRALLRGASDAYAPPDGADARVMSRLARALPELSGGGGGDGGGGTGGAGSDGAGNAGDGGRPAPSAAANLAPSAMRKLVGPLALAAAVGAAGGWLGARATTPETVRYVYLEREHDTAPSPSSRATTAAPGAARALPSVVHADELPLVRSASPVAPHGTAPSSVPPAVATALPAASAASAGDSATTTERTLLDDARAELSRGRPTQALTRLREHSAQFPSGVLREERDAMVVRALAQSGAIDEARMRAVDFKARYPNSILAPAVESAVKSRP